MSIMASGGNLQKVQTLTKQTQSDTVKRTENSPNHQTQTYKVSGRPFTDTKAKALRTHEQVVAQIESTPSSDMTSRGLSMEKSGVIPEKLMLRISSIKETQDIPLTGKAESLVTVRANLNPISQRAVLNLGEQINGSTTVESKRSRKLGKEAGGVPLDRSRLPGINGSLDIVGHSSDGGRQIEGKSPTQLALMLKNQYGLQKIKTINLISCDSEQFKSEFKQALSNLGIEVDNIEGAKGKVAVDRESGAVLNEGKVGPLHNISGHDGSLGKLDKLVPRLNKVIQDRFGSLESRLLELSNIDMDLSNTQGVSLFERTGFSERIAEIELPLQSALMNEVGNELDFIQLNYSREPNAFLDQLGKCSDKLALAGGSREVQTSIDSLRRDIHDYMGMHNISRVIDLTEDSDDEIEEMPSAIDPYDSDDDEAIDNTSQVRVKIGEDPLVANTTTIKTVPGESNIKGNELLSLVNDVVQTYVQKALEQPFNGSIVSGSDYLKAAYSMTNWKTSVDQVGQTKPAATQSVRMGGKELPINLQHERLFAPNREVFRVEGKLDHSYKAIMTMRAKFTGEDDSQLAQSLLDSYKTGVVPDDDGGDYKLFLNSLLFGLEGARNHMSYATSIMTLELIASNRMTFQEAFQDPSIPGLGGQYPMATIGSGKDNLSHRSMQVQIAQRQVKERKSFGMSVERAGNILSGKSQNPPINQKTAVQLKEAAIIKNWLQMHSVIGDELKGHDQLSTDITEIVHAMMNHYNP